MYRNEQGIFNTLNYIKSDF